eukprot:NODE_4108_length_1115_cov_86.114919_g3912_i0.p1 GENE.NODE_4108_length_1115_cov_86.114919_g3912_i0~~NODE_4108_length_1115_cov_86.114919_g3912_i0.p1  ORF type:complete len:295 (-),score=41.57 NODE_4108_length_1115_cov_86.114919_g3912_i0:149-1033(-)
MAVDRLAELRNKYGGAVESRIDIPVETKSELEGFFADVARVQAGIKEIEQLTEDIRAKHGDKIKNVNPDDDAALHEDLDSLMTSVTNKSGDVKRALKLMEEQIKLLDKSAQPAEVRIQENQRQHLVNSFVAAMKTYQKVSEQCSAKYKDRVKFRIQLTADAKGKKMSSDEVDEMARVLIEEGKEDAIFEQAKDTLERIRENHRDILRIESSMREVNQIFADMAVLVEEQGDLLNDIVANVSRSVDYVQRGREEMRTAKLYAKKSRKKMCCAIFLLLVIAGIILVPMYLSGAFKG